MKPTPSPNAIELTPDFCQSAQPGSIDLTFRDTIEAGLEFRITPKGARSFSIRYRNGLGDQKRKTWRYPDVSLSAARREARKLKGDVAKGIDVIAVEKAAVEKAERDRLDRLDVLAEAYFAACVTGTHRHRGKPKKPKELQRERDLYTKRVKPKFGDRPITSVARREIVEFIEKMTKVAGSRGRKCHALISQLFAYAVMKGVVPANIALSIPVIVPKARTRVLTDDEVRRIWSVIAAPQQSDLTERPSPEMALAMRFLATTAQRSGQTLAMKWANINWENREWECPAGDMKKELAHLVPLSQAALEILHEALETIGDEVHVFASPQTGISMRVDAASRAFARLTAGLKIGDAELHDFRRTATTAMTKRLGVTRFVAGKVLSHVRAENRNDVTGLHYDMNDYIEDKAAALDKWADHLAGIVTPRDNVVPFPSRAA